MLSNVPCRHKRGTCSTCGNCPLCPQCACNGPRRHRGRPPKQPVSAKRTASAQATRNISKQARLERCVNEKDPSSQATKMSNSYILDLLGIHKSTLLSTDKRDWPFTSLSSVERKQLFSALHKSIKTVCSMLLPSAAADLHRAFIEDGLDASVIVGAVVDGVNAARRGSKEKRILQSLLCCSFSEKDILNVLPSSNVLSEDNTKEFDKDDQNSIEEETAEPITEMHKAGMEEVQHEFYVGEQNECHINDCLQRKEGKKGTATGHKCSVCSNSVHIICCSVVLGIPVFDDSDPLFCSACAPIQNPVQNLKASPMEKSSGRLRVESPHDNDKDINASKPERNNRIFTKRNGGFCRSYQRARKDWDHLLCNGVLPERQSTKARRGDDVVKNALKFLFQSQNIQLLSWGTKRIKVGDRWERFPALMRRKTSEKIYRDYLDCQQISGSSGDMVITEKPLGRTVFLQIVEHLTRGQMTRKAAVDYILGTLVYDNVRTLRDIVSSEIMCEEYCRLFLSQLEAVEEFLKFTMLEHISSDGDPLHDPNFALDENPVGNSKLTTRCLTCLSPFQVVENIRKRITPEREDIIQVLKGAEEKMLLYMGHQHRCYNQEKRISEIFTDLNDDRCLAKAVVLLDYKMKFEPIRYREKTTEFFGKKGISWHGAAIFYCRREQHTGTEGRNTEVRTTEGTIETLFFDHVSSNDMTQDCSAVISILDAIFARLRLELPTVTGIHILSDNARCYQNDILPVVAPFLAKEHGLSLSGIIHSETQRGKSLLDAHFAIAMMHVNRYCKESRHDVTTPGEIVIALNSFGGVANCTAEMVHITKDHKELKKWVEAKREKQLCSLGRVNEVIYGSWAADSLEASCYKLSGRNYMKYEFKPFRSQKCNTDQSDSEPDQEGSESDTVPESNDVNNGIGEADEIGNGSEITTHRRPSEVAYESQMTGVLVWSRSRLRQQNKRRKKKDKDMDEIQDQTEILERQQQMQGEAPASTAEAIKEIQPVLLYCPKCTAGYRRQGAYDSHIAICKGAHPSMTVADRAQRMAFEMLNNAELAVYTTKTKHPSALTITIEEDVLQRFAQKRGWAQRPAYGKTLGENTVNRFADDIKAMFQEGQKEKGKKMSASIMRDILRKKYPLRYDVPSEYFITGFVSSLVRKHKKAVQVMSSGGGDSRYELGSTSRTVMPSRYVDKLKELVAENVSLMPRMARASLISALNLNEELPIDFPSEKAIKAKVAYLRSQRKKRVPTSTGEL